MRAAIPALLLSTLLTGVAPALAETPHVVATIKPIHALVAAVMGDRGTPELIVGGGASPHDYALRPSNAAALQNADLVFWTGPQFEVFLAESLDTVAANATIVALDDTPGLQLLPPRESGTFEAHDHDHADEHAHGEEAEHDDDHDHGDADGDDHDHAADNHDDADGHAHADHDDEEVDLHFFLDPANAKLMTTAIADALAAADPEGAETYRANAAAEIADLDALITQTEAVLAPVRDRPFVVFHDAYQYFENRFGLTVAGSVTVSPEVAPGADRIATIRAKLKTLDAACVFAEPQFDDRVIEVLVEGTGARAGVLDPEAARIEPGPGLYRQLIESLASDLTACLAQ